MKRLIIISILISSFSLVAQKNEYQYEYRLKLPSTEAYQYMEYKSIEATDTGSSFKKYLDTVTYSPTVYVLDSKLNEEEFFTVDLLDSEKKLLKSYNQDRFDSDSLIINLNMETSYLAFSYGQWDTVLFHYHADQKPHKISLVGSNEEGWGILRCKKRLNPKEMKEIYRALRLKEESELIKCKTCFVGFEI